MRLGKSSIYKIHQRKSPLIHRNANGKSYKIGSMSSFNLLNISSKESKDPHTVLSEIISSDLD